MTSPRGCPGGSRSRAPRCSAPTRAEARRWTVIGTRRLRGREADTELAVPALHGARAAEVVDEAGTADTVDGPERARSGVTRG